MMLRYDGEEKKRKSCRVWYWEEADLGVRIGCGRKFFYLFVVFDKRLVREGRGGKGKPGIVERRERVSGEG